jgi:hypothetical protein
MSVTVCIPNRNMAKTLGKAIESACRQSPLEVVVIDDASTDGSLDVVASLAERYEMLRLVSRTEKSPCWQEAAADYYDSFSGKYVICLGADDELLSGIVSLADAGDFPVIFADYLVRIDSMPDMRGLVSQGVAQATVMSPGQVRDRFMSPCNPTETGIGSLLLLDRLLWLRDRKFWRMGPWSDAIGYATVAALHGAAYVPGAGAVVSERADGYGASGRTGPDAEQYREACREFVFSSGLDDKVAKRILFKRGINA